MDKILQIILTNVLISVVIYFSIIIILILIDGKPKKDSANQNKLSFDGLALDYSEIPPLNSYPCKDGVELNYRYYPSQSNKVLVLLHGSGWHSQYFMPLAKYISSENLAHVYTPDLRGHGINPVQRGDISYMNQLEDDIVDFLTIISKKHPKMTLIIGGHSSGGGLAIRFAGSKYGKTADAYMLLTPYLKYNAPTIRKNSGGWTSIHLPRIVGLSMLNNLKITWFNYLPVIDFNMPEEYRDGTETLTYSFRLNEGFAPRNYKKDLGQMDQKLLMVAGKSDEAFFAEKFLHTVSQYKEDVKVEIIDGLSHMGIVMREEVRPVIKEWITSLEEK